jgi:hypothetical protein
MNDFLKTIAPTVASALLGPLGGVAVSAIGNLLGISDATTEKVAKVFQDGKLTPEQLSAIKELELKYINDEKEHDFKYADLAYKDRDSARKWNTEGGIQGRMFFLSCLLLAITLGCEIAVLFYGYPDDKLPEMVVGRILGLMDAVAMMVLAYHYGTTQGSLQKSNLLAQSAPMK